MAAVPPTFKTLVSALRRAEEFDKGQSREEKISGYYCRFYVVSKATRMNTNSPQEREFISSQLEILERLSPSLAIAEGEGKQICKQYAVTLFNKADEVDRAGYADKGTAKLFYSAGTLFDVMEQFGELEPEITEKKKYAKWRTVEITNAINNGETPAPPPDAPGSASTEVTTTAAMQYSGPDITATAAMSTQSVYSAPSPRTNVVPPPTAAPAMPMNRPPPVAPMYSPPITSAPVVGGPTGYSNQPIPAVRSPPATNSDPRVKDSIEICQFAIAALKHNEIALARERLQEALRRLG